MMGALIAVTLSGVLFGAGLAVSGMVDPLKVLGFLDVFGDWNPTLAFVMGGALAVAAPAYHFVKSRETPVFDARFHLPETNRVDTRLLAGAALFGVGWGLAGYCPGPAVAGLTVMWHELLWFVPAYAAGAWAAGRL